MTTINEPKEAWYLLLQNHADAWIVTFVITSGAILLHNAFSWQAVYLIFSVTVGYWLAFALNDYFDREVDALDEIKKHRNFFVVSRVQHSTAFAGFCLSAAVIAPGILQFGISGFFVLVLCFAVMWTYSAPPVRLKSRPGIDLPIHALFVETFPYILVMLLLNLVWSPLDFVILGLGVMASLTAQLEQQIRDIATDAASGETTFVISIGVENALAILKALSVFMVIYGIYFLVMDVIPLFLAPIGLVPIPAVLSRLYRQPGQPRPEHLIQPVVYFVFVYAIGLIIWRLF
ncbi:MAG: 4-hydroxybenzoate polyprenyltransferase [Cellvibrionaceae bacterium]